MNKQNGVTLIELLIVVATIGVLASIAYPSYQHYVLKGHRAQVMADMMKVQLTLEQGYGNSGSYDFNVVSRGTCSFCESDTSRYKLEIDSSGSGVDKYKINAVPQPSIGQDNDSCGTLTLNAAGIGTASGSASCW